MTEAEALSVLSSMVAADSEPHLPAGDLEELLRGARQPDSEGRAPDDPDWVPTWNLRPAAAEAWKRKAGLVADQYDFATDGQSFRRSQKRTEFLAMAATYGDGGGGAFTIRPSYEADRAAINGWT